jgi:hypothetical protein
MVEITTEISEKTLSEKATTCRSKGSKIKPPPIQPFQWKRKPSKSHYLKYAEILEEFLQISNFLIQATSMQPCHQR